MYYTLLRSVGNPLNLPVTHQHQHQQTYSDPGNSLNRMTSERARTRYLYEYLCNVSLLFVYQGVSQGGTRHNCGKEITLKIACLYKVTQIK